MRKAAPKPTIDASLLKPRFEDLYGRFNRKDLVHPDPLEFLYNYPHLMDREIVGLIASSLAYGRVAQILKSVSVILGRMPEPARFLSRAGWQEIKDTFDGFRHRFTSGQEIAMLLFGAKRTIETHSCLERYLVSCLDKTDGDMVKALSRFTKGIWGVSGVKSMSLLPDPALGSACKRLFLYLRWMVRRDQVDPGGWTGIRPSDLVIPLDTHMFRLSRGIGFTDRRQADLKAALEITKRFRELEPCDPVKYDFALTRFGIRPEMDYNTLIGHLARR
ncbi:MAG: TIGR02757 family protein [Desulfobacteraceae bacterium]|nr:TIGR02757 family protein [Desulfobacteraceae bacterium]